MFFVYNMTCFYTLFWYHTRFLMDAMLFEGRQRDSESNGFGLSYET